jgi:hypothetical protein
MDRRVDQGWARALSRGPRTVAEVLAAGRAAMEAADRAGDDARGGVTYLGVQEPRRSTLWSRLLGRA